MTDQLRAGVETLADQLCVAVDGDFDFAVRAPIAHETLEKLAMLINFVLDTARRGMSALRDHNSALAEIDRAKTVFFSNISHELRTPLTLMLGPLEEILDEKHGATSPEVRDQLVLAQRNALRLLKLVNTLLEFSRLEAGRQRAEFAPVDLAAVTSDLASVFRAAIERAGLRYVVDCEPLPQPIHVDRQMWERIVLNLLSNALKFTFEGEIAISLTWLDGSAVLTVRDSGIGIAADDLPHIFARFHRISGVRARSHEGTGIGLALVQELVKLLGGTIQVSSVPGTGTTFVLTVPAGTAHVPRDHVSEAPSASRSGAHAAFVDEALQWVGDDTPTVTTAPGARVLVADDNADMRGYLGRLLGVHWQVELVRDGDEALAAVHRERPALIVTDVMMPGRDGFGLLRALREDDATRDIPVIMLSARAGEEMKVEGHAAGADDYIVKPFTARELVARIGAQLALVQTRREMLLREQRSREEAEQRRTQAEAESRFNAALNRVSMSLVRETDTRKVMQLITDEATALVDAQFGAFFFNAKQTDGKAYMLHTLSGAKRDRFKDFPIPRVTPLFAPTFHGEGVVRLDDVRRDPRFGAMGGQPPGHVEVVSYLAVSVVGANDEVYGGLFFGHDEPAQFTAEHVRIVEAIATQAAVALERARLYEELQQSERRAREADQRKDEFLAMLGHELRNPLAPMLTAIQLLVAKKHDGREVQVLDRQVRHMMRLVDDLLDVARITRGEIELDRRRIEIANVIAKALEMASPLLEQRHHHVTSEIADGLWVDGDAVRLAQVVANVLTNAAKYTNPGGRVAIRAHRRETAVVIEVSDTGNGIASALLPRIFDMFVQDSRGPDRAAGGLGVGLTIVRRLTEAHGGRVDVHSDGPGRGSTFVIQLPGAPPADARPPDRHGPADAIRGQHLLVVDDNVDAADLLAEALRGAGHHVAVAYDGPSALEIARSYPATVALLDIGLPVMDGYELARHLLTLWQERSVRLIALTGYGLELDRLRSREAGFDLHLVKPVDLGKLIRILE